MLENLYEKPYSYNLKVHGDGAWWLVSLTDPVAGDKRPDCIVNHPRKRFGFRTAKGLEVKKYSSLNGLVWDIKEEGKKYNINFSKYKVVKNTVKQGRRVVKGGEIARKIEVREDNLDRIMRIICDSNNLDYPYEIRGFLYGRIFKLESVLRNPVPLASVLNKDNNFRVLKKLVGKNYSELQQYDYKNRGCQCFTGKPPKPEIGGFLVPLKWFEHIQYIS